MSEKNIKSRIIHKHDTEANWGLATNFIPKKGELIVYDTDDTHSYERFKIGDGVTVVSSLPFSVTKEQVGLNNVTNDAQVKRSEMGVANGVATLDNNRLVPVSQLPIVIPFIAGTQTATTGAFTGTTSEISELKDGQTIRYWLPYNGSGNATLNLTLSNGSTTGAINCYRTGTSRLTTQYAAGNIIVMTYRENVSIAGSSTRYTGWWVDADYSTASSSSIQYSGTIKCGTTAIASSNIIVGINGTYSHLKLGNAFDTTYPILYAGSAISASGSGSNNFTARTLTITTTQSITLTVYKPVFIKGTLSGTIFTPISTTPLTQTVPSSEDGYDYILLGIAYTTTSIYLLMDHPIFVYKNGKFIEKSSYELPVATSSKLGGVKPVAKTATMTQSVGVDSNGALYTAPSDPVSYVSTMPTADASSPSLVFLMESSS